MHVLDRNLQVESRPLDGLIPYVRNARKRCEGQVAQIASCGPRTLWWVAE